MAIIFGYPPNLESYKTAAAKGHESTLRDVLLFLFGTLTGLVFMLAGVSLISFQVLAPETGLSVGVLFMPALLFALLCNPDPGAGSDIRELPFIYAIIFTGGAFCASLDSLVF